MSNLSSGQNKGPNSSAMANIKIEARNLYLQRNSTQVPSNPSPLGKTDRSGKDRKGKKAKREVPVATNAMSQRAPERELATDMFELSDSEEEEPPKVIPWKNPVHLVGLADIENPDIIESLVEPMLASEFEQGNYKYEYASKKAIGNLRSMFLEYGRMLEDHEANNM
jgi:hypothetical protein